MNSAAPATPAPFPWPEGRTACVCLNYDDAVPVHREAVAPLLSRHGLTGTFYLDGRGDLRQHPDKWATVATAGHELGNHSIFHPCTKTPARSWVDPAYDLGAYTARRFREEIELQNWILQRIDGRSERTYGNTCHETEIGGEGSGLLVAELIADRVTAARGGWTGAMADPRNCDLMNIGAATGDGKGAAALIEEIESAIASGGWWLYCFHGVGEGTHSLYIDAEEHAKLVAWLGEQQERIWTTSVRDAAAHVAATREM